MSYSATSDQLNAAFGAIHQQVRLASTVNVGLPGVVVSVDGINLFDGDRVLLKDQTIASENGIYSALEVAASQFNLARSKDANSSEKVKPSMIIAVEDGVTQAASIWQLEAIDPITLGTTALPFKAAGGVSPLLPQAEILIGDATGVAQPQTVSGDVTITDAGAVTIANNAITNIKITNSVIAGGKLDYSTTFDWSSNPDSLTTGSAALSAEVTNLDTVTKQSRKMRKAVGFHQTSGLVPLLLTQDLVPFRGDLYSSMTPTPTINMVYVLSRSGGNHSAGAYLYDATNSEIITSSQVSGIVSGLPVIVRVTLNLGGAANQMKAAETAYEVRLSNTGSSAPELATLHCAYFEFTY